MSVFSANSITLSNSSSEFLVGTETSVQLCVQDETELFDRLFLTGKTSPAFPFFLHSEKKITHLCSSVLGAWEQQARGLGVQCKTQGGSDRGGHKPQ